MLFRKTLLLTCLYTTMLHASDEHVTIPIKITPDLCAELLVSHTPSADTTYKPGVDVDGEAVVPADFDGGIKVEIPKTMTIPIRFDLARFLGVPVDETVANHKELIKNIDTLTQENQALDTSSTGIETGLKSIGDATKDIRTILSTKNPTPQQITQLKQLVSQNAGTFGALLTEISKHPEQLNTISGLVSENASILDKQFNAYERDPNILDRNRGFKDQSITQSESTLENINRTISEFEALKNSFNENKELLMNSSKVLAQDYKNLSQSFDTLADTIDKTDDAFVLQSLTKDSTATDEAGQNLTLGEDLTDVKNNLEVLSENKHRYGDYLEVGVVEYVDGKLYFNNQPLFNEQQAKIADACKKLLS
jgi:chromosome segregation ATPase